MKKADNFSTLKKKKKKKKKKKTSQLHQEKRTGNGKSFGLIPYNQGVKMDIGREFLKIIYRCFAPTHKLHKILNKNTVKISYSCIPNVRSIIDGDNKRKLRAAQKPNTVKKYNCPKNTECPLEGECLANEVIYQATGKCKGKEEKCAGLTATDFKARLANHIASFKTKSKRSATELSMYCN